ncbi:hypothetical protein CH63R_06628 [Colletotrichum higginsianum IMI 349063]|uniref:Uncharacterized protein n=1 Tax=Colletotrichum higginsianum (strain IMI 349063) TaxID=759273 RepID=A0A1B7YFU9_COLHI|nr:hypothetical protein CH63R_06628 [Colletotrichum higginsianum IMI 349063]OBR10936.1 hypothetical protein CH63R_06628 [Colletotrichum higginsianum IMI 349063]
MAPHSIQTALPPPPFTLFNADQGWTHNGAMSDARPPKAKLEKLQCYASPDGAAGRGSFATLHQRPTASPTPHPLFVNGFAISSRGPRPSQWGAETGSDERTHCLQGSRMESGPPVGEWKFCVGWTSRWPCLGEDVGSSLAE